MTVGDLRELLDELDDEEEIYVPHEIEDEEGRDLTLMFPAVMVSMSVNQGDSFAVVLSDPTHEIVLPTEALNDALDALGRGREDEEKKILQA